MKEKESNKVAPKPQKGGKPKKSESVGRKGGRGKDRSREREANPPKRETGKKTMGRRRVKKEDVPLIPLNEIRLLRRPIPSKDSDRPYIIEILNGDNLLHERRFSEAMEKFNAILKMFPQSPRGLYGKGETLYGMAIQKSSNKLRETAIDFFQDAASSLLTPNDIKIASYTRLAQLHQERGKFSAAVSALEKLYALDHNDTAVANRLGTAYISAGQTQKAEEHFRRISKRFPVNFYAKAHLGYLLLQGKRYEEALPLLLEGLRKDESVRNNGRFYLYAGEALARLNRTDEAHVLYSEAVSLNLFPSLYQRSLFNEPGLRSTPWWSVNETGYRDQLIPIMRERDNITNEVVTILHHHTSHSLPPPSLIPLFSNGKRNAKNCQRAPLTCSLLSSFPEAANCKHGDAKFILVPPGGYLPPHTGAANTRLEVVVALSIGNGELEIRVAEERRSLKEGGVLVYDDSFERELWSHSRAVALVLSIDVWHPDLPEGRRKKLMPLH